MYNGTIKSAVLTNISNLPGWRTKRKIVVIESDDWGSIRMASREAYNNLLKARVPVDKSHYTKFDSLESNEDLENLFSLLTKLRDITGRPPVITGVCNVANPDFERIKKEGFSKYYYEPFTETLKRYPAHNRVYELWKEGIQNRLLMPAFHGREHLNVQKWMKALKSNNKSTHVAFNNEVTGIPRIGIDNEAVPNFQAAFDIETIDEISYLKEVIRSGLKLFEKTFNFKSSYFVPTNGWFNNSLENELNLNGVKYINTAKIQKEPLGNKIYSTNYRFLGQKNKNGQRYITRNCFFEPSSSGYEYPINTDWVDNCLKEMEIAFRWFKPAIISTHRVNYVGYLNPANRESSLNQFYELLKLMLKKWPNIEFMTSVELANIIK